MTISTRPHTAVINCMLEIHSLLDTGECSGKIVDENTLDEYGLKSRFILAVSGTDLNECLDNLKKKISVFYEKPGGKNDNVESK